MTYSEITELYISDLLQNAGTPVPRPEYLQELTHNLLDKLGFAMIQREYDSSKHNLQVSPDTGHRTKFEELEKELQLKLMEESREFWKEKYLQTL